MKSYSGSWHSLAAAFVVVYENEVHRRKLHIKYLHDLYCTAIRWMICTVYRNISTGFGTGTQKKGINCKRM